MVYFQLFDATGEARGAPLLLAPQACAEVLGSAAAIVVGSGAAAVVEARLAAGLEARLPEVEPRASVVALLAAEAAAGQPLKPLYLRAPDAKPQADRVLPRALS